MAKHPGYAGKDPQRCNACRNPAALRVGEQFLRVGGYYCRNWPVPGKKRCRFHGGLSTGPKTPEGKARAVAAMVAGRRRWIRLRKMERVAALLKETFGVPFTFDPDGA